MNILERLFGPIRKGGFNDPPPSGSRPFNDPKGQTPSPPSQGMSAEHKKAITMPQQCQGISAEDLVKMWWKVSGEGVLRDTERVDLPRDQSAVYGITATDVWGLLGLVKGALVAARADEREQIRAAVWEIAQGPTSDSKGPNPDASPAINELATWQFAISKVLEILDAQLPEAQPVEPSEGEGT